jgi:hypothetical protein
MQRQALMVALQAGRAPIGHSSHRPERVAGALATPRTVIAKGLSGDELAGPVVPRAGICQPIISRRVPEASLERG